MPTVVTFGILSTAGIARKVAQAIADARHCRVHCVGSRSLEKATAYAAEVTEATKATVPIVAMATYDEVLACPDVDVVYVPLPTSMKREWAVRAAKAGKHVLVEKPFASEADLDAIAAACAESGVVMLDGTMFQHSPRTALWAGKAALAPLIGNGGVPVQISSAFAFRLTNGSDIRLNADLEPLGSLGDLGWYCTRAILLARGGELPTAVRCTASFRDTSVPVECAVVLEFPGGCQATFQSSFSTAFRQDLSISGPEGTVTLDDFVLHRTAGVEPGSHAPEMKVWPNWSPEACEPARTVAPQGKGPRQEVQMVINLAEVVAAHKSGTVGDAHAERAKGWVDIARRTQRCMDAMMKSARNGGDAVKVEALA